MLVKGFFKKKGKECMMEGRAVGVGEDGKRGGGGAGGRKGIDRTLFLTLMKK